MRLTTIIDTRSTAGEAVGGTISTRHEQMAARYDLRSQDESAFASLPGTSSNLNFVNHNVTEQKSKAITGREMPGQSLNALPSLVVAWELGS